MGILQNYIRAILPTVLDKALKERLPSLVHEALAERFAKHPDRQLSEVGFRWAWVLRIQQHWPSVEKNEAARWLDDYMPASFGDPEYDWSARASQELADDYVREFGE